MKPRLAFVLVLIVLIPLASAGWLGARILRDEQVMVEHRMRQLVVEQLRTVTEEVDAVLQRYQAAVVSEMLSAQNPEALRRLTLESPFVRQYFLLDTTGEMLHPALDRPGSWMPSEREALERTRDIWESGVLTVSAEVEPAAASSSLRSAGAGAPQPRWHAWYWGGGLQWLVWIRDAEARIMAAELNRARFLAEILASLPDTDPSLGDRGARIRLVDSSGAPLYQWGEYAAPDGSVPLETLALHAPLGTWTLEYHAPGKAFGAAVAGGLVLNLIAVLSVVGAAVVGLGFYFYREQSRDMREAAHRVSFVNHVSHELKTPLTNIRLYAEMLEREVPQDDERSHRHLGIVVAESQRLSRLIGNILTFSRQEKRTLRLDRRPGVVDEALRSVLTQFHPVLTAKAIAVELDAHAPLPVAVDRDVVEQIVGNLVSNVEKYAAGGGSIRLASQQEGERVTVTVSDRGPGIPARERERIFQPFYRIEDQLTEGVSGTGIGLSIARELARLHGGELDLEPSRQGATFRLTLHCPRVAEGDR